MFDLIARVLAWFYDFSGSYAIAIVLLTFLIMLVLTPLTLKGTRSMMRIQQLQPELKRIQTKHKGDRQKINEETMALYQKHGANPLAGCLPTLVQLPVFIVLYRVINGMTKMGKDGIPDPSYLKKESSLYQDLVTDGGQMVSFGIDLSESAKDVIQANFVDGLPYLALVGITFVLSFLQQAQMKAHRGDAAAQNPQMEMLMKIMPYMLPIFAFLVQAALGVYFVASSLYRIGQQAFIHKTMKPIATIDAATETEIIEAVAEETSTKDVPNQRSQKAIAAQEQRRQAREARSKQRKSGGSERPKKNPPQKGQKAQNDDDQKPIQSKRTSGDGRTRKRRK
ncbi:MAG: YidC/Oxa1 family membrane protein insertase [Acidimicrobiales bacterium]|jgi:YidC/Oxa1 family membrane protein insertase|nr:YidC/Oxa1 family membrane protein insertase [Acidimicrobiales bacterium]